MQPIANKTYPSALSIYGALIFIPFAWGTTFVFLKEIVKTTDPNLLIFYRFGMAALILALIALLKKLDLFKNWKSGFFLGVVIWLAFASQFFGLQHTSIANSAFITGMFIIFIPFLSRLINKRQIKFKHLLAVLISLVGLWFLTGGVGKINIGDVLTIITALAAATHVVLCEKFMRQDNHPLVTNFQQMAVCCVLSLVLFLIFNPNTGFNVSGSNFLSILYLALVATVGAYLAQLWVQKYASAMAVSLFFTLEPVFAVLFAFVYAKEVLTTSQIIGCIMMVLAIVFLEMDFVKFKLYFYGTPGQ